MKPGRVRLTSGARRALRSQHPWIFADWIESGLDASETGALVAVYDDGNRFAGMGLWDATSPIRVRMIEHGPVQWGPGLVRDRLAQSHAQRAPIWTGDTTGYRVVHGPNDGLPGVVVDRYGSTVVVKLYASSWLRWLDILAAAIQDELAPRCLVLRTARNVEGEEGSSDGTILFGQPEDGGRVPFLEHGLWFEADPVKGQKTGFFLDQRDNRARLRARTRGRTVLNVFSYTGGFSLYAAAGGATDVESVDLSRHACEGAERNFARNAGIHTVAACRHRATQADAFEFLEGARRRGATWDVVIVDPPSFAKAAREKEGARTAYARLARLAWSLVAPGGELLFASCSSRVSADELEQTLVRALPADARADAPWERWGHAVDHPIRFPEFAYLKCFRVPRDG
jgi:23S rRNA (cytosine1962-C5)-methyltransferase